MTARVPPHDLAAEESLLGAMLLSPKAVDAVTTTTTAEDFYKPIHSHIYAAIVEVHTAAESVDVVTVASTIEARGAGDAETPSYLTSLVANVGSTTAAPTYARIVTEHARRRRMLGLAGELAEAAYSGDNKALAKVAEGIVSVPGGRSDETGLLAYTVRAAAARSASNGASFILDTPAEVVPVWGEGENVAWASGEPLLVNGPPGVGKTTLVQQVLLGRLGLRDSVLGMPVAQEKRRVLYIAADRPAQAARSLRRMVDEDERDELSERLQIWRGPLPFDLGRKPELLCVLADEYDAGTVIIDSLKDVALRLTEDEAAATVNQAFQLAVAQGIEVLALHHQRKGQQGAGKPRSLEDVYGSVWLTAGAGSVLLLWGQAGDAVVELTHLKQPSGDIGPMTLVHDHVTGSTTLRGQVDLMDLLANAKGVTAAAAAAAIFNNASPSANQVEKARRRLERLVRDDLARRKSGPGDGGRQATVYLPSETEPPLLRVMRVPDDEDF